MTLYRTAAWAALAALAAASGARAAAVDGEAAFTASCSACHQTTGKGIPGAFPALAGDPYVVGPPTLVIGTVLNGRGGMPTFKGDLDDDTIAAILTYVRSSWGNKAKGVEAADVAAVRAGVAAAAPRGLTAH